VQQLTFTEAIKLNETLPIRFVFKVKFHNHNDVIYNVGELIKTLNEASGLVMEAGSWYVHNVFTGVATSIKYLHDPVSAFDAYAPVFTDSDSYTSFVSKIPKDKKIEITMKVLD
jgi:hypothetical protein